MPSKEIKEDPIPKYKKEKYSTVAPNVYENPFFKAEELRPGIYKISQPWFREEALHVYCFLIVGTAYAIVYDTMFGYGNLREFCEQITNLPLIVVNSHFHGDHAAGNFHFDRCYIHHYDLPGIYQGFAKTPEDALAQAQKTAKPEFRDHIQMSDICMPKPMYTYPLYDGDLFDIGDRTLQVVHVGGHSSGSIMLIDRKNKVAFSGDTCNNDTIITRSPDSIEDYLAGLRHLRKYTDGIDFLFGGHEDFPASIIDEGIELAERIVNGTDDHAEYTIPFPPGTKSTVLFGAEMTAFYRRTDGKDANIQYSPDNIRKKSLPTRILTTNPPAAGRVEEEY